MTSSSWLNARLLDDGKRLDLFLLYAAGERVLDDDGAVPAGKLDVMRDVEAL